MKSKKHTYDYVNRMYIKYLLQYGFLKGNFTEEQLYGDNPMQFAVIEIETIRKSGAKVPVVIDHSEEILKDAKKFIKTKRFEYAKVFYALYYEHSVNSLVKQLMIRKRIPPSSMNNVLRLSLNDKLTWVLDLLATERPSEEFIKHLKPLSDDRNSFMHYKWSERTFDDFFEQQERDESLAKELDTQVKYLEAYVSKILYNSNKKKIIKYIEKLVLNNDVPDSIVLHSRKA